MDWEASFDAYLEHLCKAVGHSDRRSGLVGYCQVHVGEIGPSIIVSRTAR
jgi:hypothetical protein